MAQTTDPHSAPDAARAARLRAIFDEAIEQPIAARTTWIEAHVADAADRAALCRLLEADDRDGLLERPADERMQRIGLDDALLANGLVGQRVGAFRLTRLIGEGGMAVVFHGEREGGEFHQEAAVKLLRRGLHSPFEQRLFRREQQALAALSHPNITHLIDGGISEGGLPYLILEYVHGVPITDYVARHDCGLRERLALFVVVCRAVAAAHRRLIVHRDLKPSNILVDDSGQAKLLDFGIAKLLADDGDAARTEMTVLTPGYAAPEQFTGEAVTTATDVYSLGVVLHELLLGARPPMPSLHPDGAQRDEPAATPADAPARTAFAIRGDLDNVLRKALSTEPERRYHSAAELADDIERYLNEQPVLAHPPSRWYRARKFMRRHRGGVAVTAALACAVLASLAIALWQAHVARQEAHRAGAFRDFMVTAFREAQPLRPREGPPRITEVVDDAVRRAEADAQLPPRVRVELLTELGAVLRTQGDAQRAAEVLGANHERAQREFGAGSDIAVETGLQRLEALMKANETVAGRTLADELLAQAATDMPEHQVRARVLSSLLAMAEQKHERAFADVEQALAIARADGGADALATALAQHAQMLFVGGRLAEAAQAAEEMLALRTLQFGEAHASVVTAQANLSRIQRRLGRLDAAEHSIRAAIALGDRIYPPDHPMRALHLNALLLILRDRRDFPAALEVARETERITRAAYGAADRFTVIALSNIGAQHLMMHDNEGARGPLAEAVAIADAHLRAYSSETVNARKSLGLALARSGDVAAGVAQMERALADAGEAPTPDHDLRASICLELAMLHLVRGDPDAASEPLAGLDDALTKFPRGDRFWNGRADLVHAEAYLQRGQADAARARLAAASTALADIPGVNRDLDVLLPLLEARLALADGDRDRAATLARLGRERFDALPYPPLWAERALAAVEQP